LISGQQAFPKGTKAGERPRYPQEKEREKENVGKKESNSPQGYSFL